MPSLVWRSFFFSSSQICFAFSTSVSKPAVFFFSSAIICSFSWILASNVSISSCALAFFSFSLSFTSNISRYTIAFVVSSSFSLSVSLVTSACCESICLRNRAPSSTTAEANLKLVSWVRTSTAVTRLLRPWSPSASRLVLLVSMFHKSVENFA